MNPTPRTGPHDRRGATRRSAVLGGLGLLTGGPLLSACTTASPPSSTPATASVDLPTYLEYTGVEPDIRGSVDGLANAYFTYPTEPVRATDGPPGDGEPITAMTSLNGAVPPGVAHNAYWRELNARLGSPLSITPTPLQDYSQKFSTTVAGHALPDVFNLLNATSPAMPALLAASAVDLSPHLSGDNVAAYPHLANIPTASWQATLFDGRIMAVPIPRGVTQSVVLYYRKDLLGQRGIDFAPADFAEFADLCKQLTDGRHNVWALASAPIDHVRQMLGVPNNWSQEGGALTSAYEHEGQEQALDATRRLIADGLVNPDAFGASTQDAKTWFTSGRTMLTVDTQSAWSGFFAAASGDDFDIDTAPPPPFDGTGRATPWIGSPAHSVAAVGNRAAHRIETVLKVLDYLASPFGTEEYRFLKYGVQDTDFTLRGSDPIKTAQGNAETVIGTGYLADGPVSLYQAGRPDVTETRYTAQTKLFPDGVRDPVETLFSATRSSKGTFLTTRMSSLQNDILQGREPVSAWQEGVASWRSGGGDQMRAELEAVLAAQGGDR